MTPQNHQYSIKSIKLLLEQRTAPLDIVVLPSLHSYPYPCQRMDQDFFQLAESIPGPVTDELSAIARNHSIVIVGTVFEYRSPGIYHHTAVVLDKDGSLAGIYRNMHLANEENSYETYYFTPGDKKKPGFTPIKTSMGKIGILLGMDQWYPEAARLMTLAGAEILACPSAIGWSQQRNGQTQELDAWITLQRSHAIANQVPMCIANRCGFEPQIPNLNVMNSPFLQDKNKGTHFWGHSFITNPEGEVLAKTMQSDQAVLISAMHDNQRNKTIQQQFSLSKNRRIDAYNDISKRCID